MDHWESQGHRVLRLVRDKPDDRKQELFWDYQNEIFDWTPLAGFDALIHLAGRPITTRWTRSVKREIKESRVKSTQHLAKCLNAMPNPPATFISASAIGYYGDRDDEILTESSGLGEGFLTDVCEGWEAAAGPARKGNGIRVVNTRFGVVLSKQGGALDKMLGAFGKGLGGRLGDGKQYMSWIALADVVGAIDHILTHETMRGPVNVVAPNPVTNAELTDTLGYVLGKPTPLPVPATMLKLTLGDMARDMLLASARVHPEALQKAGYVFRFPDLREALEAELGNGAKT